MSDPFAKPERYTHSQRHVEAAVSIALLVMRPRSMSRSIAEIRAMLATLQDFDRR